MVTIQKAVENGFLATKNEYEKALRYYYPARENNGFTERNLTSYFVPQFLAALNEEAFAWYEMPWLDNRKRFSWHMDAVVFVPARRVIVYIEAKQIKPKFDILENVIPDEIVQRMLPTSKRQEIVNRMLPPNGRGQVEYREFIMYIADVWTKPGNMAMTKWKNHVPIWWDPGLQIEQVKPDGVREAIRPNELQNLGANFSAHLCNRMNNGIRPADIDCRALLTHTRQDGDRDLEYYYLLMCLFMVPTQLALAHLAQGDERIETACS
jgi:hypothetical protein